MEVFMQSRSTLSTSTATKSQQGFTLLEIHIVLGILGSIMAFVLTQVAGQSEQAKGQETTMRASSIQQALMRYQVDIGKLPDASNGLGALWANPGSGKWSGPYIEEKDAVDGWKNPFEYDLTGKGAKLTSRGKDGEPGTADDLVYINGKQVEEAAATDTKPAN
jgi:general secretion pathway protein G